MSLIGKISLIILMSWIMSCQGSQTGESTAAVRDSSLVKLKAEKEESRPTDEGDMVPGYLIDPQLVTTALIAGGQTQVVGASGAVALGKGVGTYATIVFVLDYDEQQSPENQLAKGTTIAVTEVAADGSFSLLFDEDQYPSWILTITDSVESTVSPSLDQDGKLRVAAEGDLRRVTSKGEAIEKPELDVSTAGDENNKTKPGKGKELINHLSPADDCPAKSTQNCSQPQYLEKVQPASP